MEVKTLDHDELPEDVRGMRVPGMVHVVGPDDNGDLIVFGWAPTHHEAGVMADAVEELLR